MEKIVSIACHKHWREAIKTDGRPKEQHNFQIPYDSTGYKVQFYLLKPAIL